MKALIFLILGALFLPLASCKQSRQPETPQQYEYLVSSESDLVNTLKAPLDKESTNNNEPKAMRVLTFHPAELTMALNVKANEGWRLIQIDRSLTRTAGSINSSSEVAKGVELHSETEAHFFFERAK